MSTEINLNFNFLKKNSKNSSIGLSYHKLKWLKNLREDRIKK